MIVRLFIVELIIGSSLFHTSIYNKYSDIVNFKTPEDKRHDEGRGLVVFNSSNYLEIAVYKSNSATVGSASTLMGLSMRDTVTINFEKN